MKRLICIVVLLFTITPATITIALANTSDKQPAIHRVASANTSFFSNSYIIEGLSSVAIVDAHMDEADANSLRENISAIGKPVETIVITHRHPDHFMGLKYLYRHFPDAQIVASVDTAQVIAEAALYWQEFENDIVELANTEIRLAGRTFQAAIMPDSESAQPLVLYESSSRTLISGDLVLNGQHLWLAEGRLDEWLENLDSLKTMFDIELLLPGHGVPKDVQSIENTRHYIQFFQKTVENATDFDTAYAQMRIEFPTHVFVNSLEISLAAFGLSR